MEAPRLNNTRWSSASHWVISSISASLWQVCFPSEKMGTSFCLSVTEGIRENHNQLVQKSAHWHSFFKWVVGNACEGCTLVVSDLEWVKFTASVMWAISCDVSPLILSLYWINQTGALERAPDLMFLGSLENSPWKPHKATKSPCLPGLHLSKRDSGLAGETGLIISGKHFGGESMWLFVTLEGVHQSPSWPEDGCWCVTSWVLWLNVRMLERKAWMRESEGLGSQWLWKEWNHQFCWRQ